MEKDEERPKSWSAAHRCVKFKLNFNDYYDLENYAKKAETSIHQYAKKVLTKHLAKRNLERFELRKRLDEKFRKKEKIIWHFEKLEEEGKSEG